MLNAAIALVLAGMLLMSGCISTAAPSIRSIGKNNSSADDAHPDYGGNAAIVQDESPLASLPPLPEIPPVPKPNDETGGSLKLVNISQKGGATLAPIGAVALAWKGDAEGEGKEYALKIGETAILPDGTKLELASLNSDWSKGNIWATFVIGGTRRTANVGQVADAGEWRVKTLDLYLPPEKVSANFLLTVFGAQRGLNVSSGGKIYASQNEIYDVTGIYEGYAQNYRAVALSNGKDGFVFTVGEEKALPLGQ